MNKGMNKQTNKQTDTHCDFLGSCRSQKSYEIHDINPRDVLGYTYLPLPTSDLLSTTVLLQPTTDLLHGKGKIKKMEIPTLFLCGWL